MRVLAPVILFATSLSVAPASDDLVTHEWGTFTSVASEKGSPVSWAPLFGPADLPCFVVRNGVLLKSSISGLVRMETPVLYFYSKTPVTLSVHVDFPKGQITEWYPQSTSGTAGAQISWDSVHVLPEAKLDFPMSKGASHYFAARETDSAPLRIGNQEEKLIFYRGVGNFLPPLWPHYTTDGKIEVSNTGTESIPLAIVFESHGDTLGYRIVRGVKESVTVDPPEMSGNLDQLRQELVTDLVEFGLYKKEALAMVETWRDSWFEQGTRVFYIMPTAQVNPLLPLTITPAPSDIKRVFVGRVEVLSPWTEKTIQTAMHDGDTTTLSKFGRFLDPFLTQMKRRNVEPSAMDQKTNVFVLNARSQSSAPACVE